MADSQIEAMDGKREFGVEFRRDEGLWSDGSVCSQGVNCTEMMWYDLQSLLLKELMLSWLARAHLS